jgi:hypothetical protein
MSKNGHVCKPVVALEFAVSTYHESIGFRCCCGWPSERRRQGLLSHFTSRSTSKRLSAAEAYFHSSAGRQGLAIGVEYVHVHINIYLASIDMLRDGGIISCARRGGFIHFQVEK